MKFFSFLMPSGEKSVQAVETWSVRWRSRHGEYYSDTRPEVRVFVEKELADDFANSLRNAFKLIKHTSDIEVIVSINK